MLRLLTVAFVAVALVSIVGGGCSNEPVDVVKNRPPLAVAGLDTAAVAGAVVAFDGSASTDPDGHIASYAWDFGDGTSGTGASASHIYNGGGAFTVTLTVIDDRGAKGADTLIVTVDDNQPPVAVINAPGAANAAASVRFDGSASTDADGTIATYDWDFGDGDVGAGAQFDHAFAAAGSYDVVLTVTDDKGASGDATVTVVVADVVSYEGQWTWTLVDPSQRDLGFACGTFEDSQLDILTNEPSMTITEHAGGTSVTYSGTLADVHFDVSNSELGIVQEIVGDFDSPTSFTGFYKIDPGFTTCDDRAVVGTKL